MRYNIQERGDGVSGDASRGLRGSRDVRCDTRPTISGGVSSLVCVCVKRK